MLLQNQMFDKVVKIVAKMKVRNMRPCLSSCPCVPLWLLFAVWLTPVPACATERFEGEFYHGEGDREYLELLDIARRMFDADPEFQNAAMLLTGARFPSSDKSK